MLKMELLVELECRVLINSRRIREFTAVIRKAYPEDARKSTGSKPVVKPVKDRDNRGRIISVAKESQHKLSLDEMDREEHFPAAGADNGIKFRNREIRMELQEGLEIRIGTSDTAGLIHFEVDRVGAGLKPHFPWEIDVPCGKGTGIDEPVDGPFTDYKRILVVLKDVMRGDCPCLIKGETIASTARNSSSVSEKPERASERVSVYSFCASEA